MDRSLLILSRSCRFHRLRVVAVRRGRRQRPQGSAGMFRDMQDAHPGLLVPNYYHRTVAEGLPRGTRLRASAGDLQAAEFDA
jgi:hypothetical protein